ncbi:uncharacterized protein LOC129906760 [Episyrphus balteatus]|uniref:uncharacterized protein LOC129906760 n=1 Tax=Episyrphus balteatus TaxID=286459 RepID=UPI002486502C|nr:uncharacterized protein LOC129906760 [Episyrphus balteatus]
MEKKNKDSNHRRPSLYYQKLNSNLKLKFKLEMRTITYFIQICLLFWICASEEALEYDWEAHLERLEPLEGSNYDIDFSNLRVLKGRNRTHVTSSFTGSFTYHKDMDNTYSYGVKILRSALGDGDYRASPYQYEQTPMCKFYQGFFRKTFSPSFETVSDFPEIPQDGLCPIPKGTYHIKSAFLKERGELPKHVQPGVYRLEVTCLKNMETLVGGFNVYARVFKKQT